MSSRASPTEREEARSRHPANGRWRPDLRRLAEQVATRLREEGLEWPDVAAAALAARGVAGVDQRAFAAQLGVPEATLVAAETGALPAHALPPALRQVLPIHPFEASSPPGSPLDPSSLEAAVALQAGEFHTADIAAHAAVDAAGEGADLPGELVSSVGRWLAGSSARLGLERLPPDGRALGARWRRQPTSRTMSKPAQ